MEPSEKMEKIQYANEINSNDVKVKEDSNKTDNNQPMSKLQWLKKEFTINKKLLPIKIATLCYHGGK